MAPPNNPLPFHEHEHNHEHNWGWLPWSGGLRLETRITGGVVNGGGLSFTNNSNNNPSGIVVETVVNQEVIHISELMEAAGLATPKPMPPPPLPILKLDSLV